MSTAFHFIIQFSKMSLSKIKLI